MALVRGPFELRWGLNILSDIEEIDFSHEVDSEEYTTIQGRTIEVDGNYKVSAVITLLASDIPALAMIVPQYYVPNGGKMSTGETVNNVEGAIDFKASNCNDAVVYNNFDIVSCGNPAHILRIVKARTRIDGVEIDDKIQKVKIKIIGESPNGAATIQLFREGSLSIVS